MWEIYMIAYREVLNGKKDYRDIEQSEAKSRSYNFANKKEVDFTR